MQLDQIQVRHVSPALFAWQFHPNASAYKESQLMEGQVRQIGLFQDKQLQKYKHIQIIAVE